MPVLVVSWLYNYYIAIPASLEWSIIYTNSFIVYFISWLVYSLSFCRFY